MMRAVINFCIFIAICTLSSAAYAQTGFYLPSSPTSYGQDEFRAADGTTCRTSMDGAKRVELGTYASAGQNPAYGGYSYPYPNYYNAPMQGNAGVYGRYTMSLDASPDRIDCKKLFDLEMERRKLEVELLKRSLVAADTQLDDLKSQRRASKSSNSSQLKEESKEHSKKIAAAVVDEKFVETPRSSRSKEGNKKRDLPPL